MNLGTNEIKGIYAGTIPAQVYVGNVKVWPEEEPAGGYWGLCFTAEEPGATVGMTKTGTPPEVSLLYSTDASTWNTFTAGETIVTLANAGDKVWLKAGPGGNTAFATNSSNYTKFVTSKSNASGNIMSLLDGEQQQTSVSARYCFCYLFNGSSIKTAPELPATSIVDSCYYSMFGYCTSLAQVPALPATTLASNCYNNMFHNCTSLTQAPALPATSVQYNSYNSMFRGCTSLSAAPELPATTLDDSCYYAMFRGCTSLSAAPALPSTTLAGECYRNMFYDCTSLTQAPALPATTIAYNSYNSMFYNCTSLQSVSVSFSSWGGTQSWLYNVSSSGTFYCPTALGTDATITRGVNNCPTGWTVINTDVA